jgi:hypothetical protein
LLHGLGPRLRDEDIALLLCQSLDCQLQNQVVPLRLCQRLVRKLDVIFLPLTHFSCCLDFFI